MKFPILTNTAKYYFIDEILVSEILPNVNMDLEEFEYNNKIRAEIIGENQVALLLDIRELKGVNYETREASRKEVQNGHYNAVAILVENSISRMIGAIALGFNKPMIPIKVFTDKEKALLWLKNYAIVEEKTQKYG